MKYWTSFHVLISHLFVFLEKCLFRSPAQFLIGLFVFLVLSSGAACLYWKFILCQLFHCILVSWEYSIQQKIRDFPDGPVVKTSFTLGLQGARDQSLIDAAKKKKKKKKRKKIKLLLIKLILKGQNNSQNYEQKMSKLHVSICFVIAITEQKHSFWWLNIFCIIRK